MFGKKKFVPPWWLRNRHLQSCIGAVFKSAASAAIRWQEFNLPDGDFIDLAWLGEEGRPTVFIVTGLEGNVFSHYVQQIARYIIKENWQVCVIHYRGCSGRPNRLARTYCVADFKDCDAVIRAHALTYPDIPTYAIGFSMGSNVLAKYLIAHPQSSLKAVCLVSCAFEVGPCVDYCGRFYGGRFVRSVSQKLIEKIGRGHQLPVTHDEVLTIHSMREMDRKVTAPMFNYKSENDYYDYASIREDLPNISHPILLLHAKDDPFVPLETVPSGDELNNNSHYILTEQGGHIGFMGGGYPWQLEFWVGEQIMPFF